MTIHRWEPASKTVGREYRDGGDRTEKCLAFLYEYKQLCERHGVHLAGDMDGFLYVETGVKYRHNYFTAIYENETLGPVDD